jgi:catechol 2,3-dioxygenase-like lactoylglutathione lyase family enzyme
VTPGSGESPPPSLTPMTYDPIGSDDHVRWRGVHHLALVTDDMDVTVRFWHGVLDARLVSTVATPTFKHYFFEIAPGSTIAFFEYLDAPIAPFAKPAGVAYEGAVQFDHLSLALADEAAVHALQARLRAHDCEVTEVVDHGVMKSIYFTDPNGIALEASWWISDATARPARYDDPHLFADPDPVPALRELAATGSVASTPATRLVDGVTFDVYRTPSARVS